MVSKNVQHITKSYYAMRPRTSGDKRMRESIGPLLVLGNERNGSGHISGEKETSSLPALRELEVRS